MQIKHLFIVFVYIVLLNAEQSSQDNLIDFELINSIGQEIHKKREEMDQEQYPLLILVSTTNAPVQIIIEFLKTSNKINESIKQTKTLQLFLGLNDNFIDLISNIKDIAQTDEQNASMIENTLNIRFDGAWIKKLNIGNKAPVYALAECRGDLYPENCIVLSRLEGDVGLERLLALSKEKNILWANELFDALHSKDKM